MLDLPQEARLNLVIYYLRNREVVEAFNLIKDLEPSTPPEYILKGVVHTCYGQMTDHSEHLKIAQQYFQLVRHFKVVGGEESAGWGPSSTLAFCVRR